jgi:hypothetical protein
MSFSSKFKSLCCLQKYSSTKKESNKSEKKKIEDDEDSFSKQLEKAVESSTVFFYLKAYFVLHRFVIFIFVEKVHRIANIYRQKNKPIKIFLILLWLASFSYCMVQIVKTLIAFSNYDTITESDFFRQAPAECKKIYFFN